MKSWTLLFVAALATAAAGAVCLSWIAPVHTPDVASANEAVLADGVSAPTPSSTMATRQAAKD